MNKKLELVDFLRGFAIFTIALMHLVQGSLIGTLNKAAAFGRAGVHVFILVSGFGLYLSYLRKPVGYGEFLKKRFGKVYWPYAIAVMGWMLWILASSGDFMWQEGLSHLLLYKMFFHDLDVSFCYPYWFISTIIQFYLCWPLILRVARLGAANSKITGYGLSASILISLSWATVVGLLGYEELRPWGSCFLQYLWEFILGMWLAELLMKTKTNNNLENPKEWKWCWLIGGAIIGMVLTGAMGWIGGVLKLYNDIPSLLGYLSLLLITYKISCSFGSLAWIKKFFMWASGFGYELYLVHSLMYSMVRPLQLKYIGENNMAMWLWITVTFVLAYLFAWSYSNVLKMTIYRRTLLS